MKLLSLEEVRKYSSNFVAERQWNQFHTQTNLVMALSGECGELAEIFQWKGPISKENLSIAFNEKEIIHIGEEVSDILIYSTRLCDICGIDLPIAIRESMSAGSPVDRNAVDGSWHEWSFEDISTLIQIPTSYNVRLEVLKIQASSGKLCQIFVENSESLMEYKPLKLNGFNLDSMERTLAEICISLISICIFFQLDIGKCVYDKFKKNEAKYPVSLARGSSAKYTEYIDKLQQSSNES